LFLQEIYADFKQYESIHFENMIVECRHLWNKQYSVTRNVRNWRKVGFHHKS